MKNNKGFTLIEVVIYMALFAIIMGGLITTTYQLSQSAGSLQGKGITQEEMNFVLKKFDWAFTGVPSSVVVTSSKINFTNLGQSYMINLSGSNDIQMSVNGTTETLTTKNVKITNLAFTYSSSNKLITATFTIDGIVANYTKYLKV